MVASVNRLSHTTLAPSASARHMSVFLLFSLFFLAIGGREGHESSEAIGDLSSLINLSNKSSVLSGVDVVGLPISRC